jgi:hypothetical protein
VEAGRDAGGVVDVAAAGRHDLVDDLDRVAAEIGGVALVGDQLAVARDAGDVAVQVAACARGLVGGRRQVGDVLAAAWVEHLRVGVLIHSGAAGH